MGEHPKIFGNNYNNKNVHSTTTLRWINSFPTLNKDIESCRHELLYSSLDKLVLWLYPTNLFINYTRTRMHVHINVIRPLCIIKECSLTSGCGQTLAPILLGLAPLLPLQSCLLCPRYTQKDSFVRVWECEQCITQPKFSSRDPRKSKDDDSHAVLLCSLLGTLCI